MPSYGWWIDQGATTTWEEWNGNGSRNHPMFGGGISWFYRYMAGMNPDPEKPGYRHFIVRPVPPAEIERCAYSLMTPYGTASSAWKRNGSSFSLEVVVPPGCSATVYIPSVAGSKVTEGGIPVKERKDLNYSGMENGYSVCTIPAGSYSFNSQTL
jgi:alpha-L-rhamnosidase